MSIDHDLVERAKFGFNVDDFLDSQFGQYLQIRADDQIKEAHADLETVKPHDTEKIRELQQKIARARQWREWFHEAVNDGKAAAHEAEQELSTGQ
jgi:hypothetical protein